MSNSGGLNRTRARAAAPTNEQVLTRLGRVTPSPIAISANPTTVVQHSGTIPMNRPRPINVESETSRLLDVPNADALPAIPVITHFDAEQYRTEIKAHAQDEKRLEQLVLNAIYYFVHTSKRSTQQPPDYTVLTLLAWTVATHGHIFRRDLVVKALCLILKGSNLTKTTRNISMMNNGSHPNYSTTPYTLVCQILWLAFKDKNDWPVDFIEAYVEDALGEQNWIKNNDCRLFVTNIQTAFNTRPSTWKLDQSKPLLSAPAPSNPQPTVTDETSNDSVSMNVNESESSLPAPDENNSMPNSDHQSIVPRYEGRTQTIQTLLQTLLNSNAKVKSIGGNPNALSNSAASNPSSTGVGSQPHEPEKLLALFEHLCGLPEIRLQILGWLGNWLQNPKLHNQAEKLMITLCENLTKRPSPTHSISNGVSNHQDTNYIDERAIEQLVNLRFKVRVSNASIKMHISCIREMLKHDGNLVDHVVRFIIHNELQQIPTTTALNSTSGKNPNNLQLLQGCCQAQPELACQSVAYTIQNILLGSNAPSTQKDYDNLLKSIRPFVRELMKCAKQEFDSVRFCMYLLDMHYSNALQNQLWTMMSQPASGNDLPPNEITSTRLLKRLLECDMASRERFLNAICDLVPMVILATAHAFHVQYNLPTSNNRSSANANIEQRMHFMQRLAFIQCSCCLFFWHTLSRVLDASSNILGYNYISCLYNVLFTTQVTPYLRIENWPSEESLRLELFRLSYEVPILGETLFLLIQIGLTPHFNLSQPTVIDLLDLLVQRTFNVEQKLPSDIPSSYLQIPANSCEIFLKKFFDLTLYIIPIKIQLPPTYQLPANLAVTETFCKAIIISLLIASHDPPVFGRYVWSSVPQIRLLMEMLLTGDYTCPPNSMIESKQFIEKFRMNERVHLRKEKDTILELEKYLAAPRLIDESTSQLLGKVILLDLQHIRRPSIQEKTEQAFYTLIQELNKTLQTIVDALPMPLARFHLGHSQSERSAGQTDDRRANLLVDRSDRFEHRLFECFSHSLSMRLFSAHDYDLSKPVDGHSSVERNAKRPENDSFPLQIIDSNGETRDQRRTAKSVQGARRRRLRSKLFLPMSQFEHLQYSLEQLVVFANHSERTSDSDADRTNSFPVRRVEKRRDSNDSFDDFAISIVESAGIIDRRAIGRNVSVRNEHRPSALFRRLSRRSSSFVVGFRSSTVGEISSGVDPSPLDSLPADAIRQTGEKLPTDEENFPLDQRRPDGETPLGDRTSDRSSASSVDGKRQFGRGELPRLSAVRRRTNRIDSANRESTGASTGFAAFERTKKSFRPFRLDSDRISADFFGLVR